MKSFNDFMNEAWQEGAGKAPVSEKLIGKQKKLDKNHNGKLDAEDFKKLRGEEVEEVEEDITPPPKWKKPEGSKPQNRQVGSKMGSNGVTPVPVLKKEELELDEGRVKELAYDLDNMSHDEFHKQYGKPKHYYDPKNFKKPVQPGKGMDRAKALAQRGMQSLSKEEVERIEEKLAQLGEGTYKHEVEKSFPASGVKTGDSAPKGTTYMPKDKEKAKGKPAGSIGEEKLTQIDELSKDTLGNYVKKAIDSKKNSEVNAKHSMDMYAKHSATGEHPPRRNGVPDAYERSEYHQAKADKRAQGIKTAAKKLGEETEQEMSPYLKATLAVMDEGKIDNLRDAQSLRNANKSAFDKDYKQDNNHPHITLVKGNKYGGSNQKDDEGDEKPDNETKEKRGRGRPSGSKSGARQKGNGHEDGGIPVHNLHLPNRNK